MTKMTSKEILAQYPRLKGSRQTKVNGVLAQKKRIEICDFARDHNFVINPGRGYDYYIESFFMFDCCPCDKTRLKCPCDEAIEEVPRVGHCLCRLFWRSLDDFSANLKKKEDD